MVKLTGTRPNIWYDITKHTYHLYDFGSEEAGKIRDPRPDTWYWQRYSEKPLLLDGVHIYIYI